MYVWWDVLGWTSVPSGVTSPALHRVLPDTLRIHHDPDWDNAVTEDEWQCHVLPSSKSSIRSEEIQGLSLCTWKLCVNDHGKFCPAGVRNIFFRINDKRAVIYRHHWVQLHLHSLLWDSGCGQGEEEEEKKKLNSTVCWKLSVSPQTRLCVNLLSASCWPVKTAEWLLGFGVVSLAS